MKTQLKSIYKGFLIVVATSALASLSAAQRYDREFNSTMEGHGSVHVNGATYDFNRLQVTLQQNDRLTIHAFLRGRDSRDVVFSGRLSNRQSRNRHLTGDIDSVAYGRDTDTTDATCSIDMGRGDGFGSVTVSGRNRTDHNNVSLDFTSTGRSEGDYDHNGDHDHGWRAAGNYVDIDEWRNRGDHFRVKYSLELQRDGDARLVVSADDRNMPDGRDSRYDHGDILKYLQHGQDVIQTGHWSQNGDRITIKFDRIRYSMMARDKDETLRGRLRGGTIWMEDYEKSFYGHNVKLSFESSR